jgi:hypothetical protein
VRFDPGAGFCRFAWTRWPSPVDEEVDQRFETLVVVGVAEILGDGDEVGELLHGELGDVVACRVCRLPVQRALDLDAELCRLVEGEAVARSLRDSVSIVGMRRWD